MQEVRSVRIGEDEQVQLGRFRGLKALEVSAVVTDIVQNVPEITDKANQFVQEFEKHNTVTLTPAMTVLPLYRELGLTPEDVRAEPEGTLTIPRPPTVQQQLIHILPDLFKVAREQITRLIGLVAMPNSELEKADDEDSVQQASFEYGRQLMRRAYIDQCADLLIASWAVMSDQFADREDLVEQLGELPLLGPLLSMVRNRGSLASTGPEPQEDETDRIVAETLLNDEPQSSSTDSPAPTAGVAGPPSSGSPGESS